MRVAIGGFQHETNTFAPSKATYANFERAKGWPGLQRGGEMLETMVARNLPIAGFIEQMKVTRHTLVPTAWAAAPQMSGGWLRCRAYRDVACPSTYPAAQAEGRAANAVLRAYAAAHFGVTYVDAAGALCDAGTCPIIDHGKLLYSDGSHLTRRAAARVVARVPSPD